MFRLNGAAVTDIQTGTGVYKGDKHMGTGLQQDAGGGELTRKGRRQSAPLVGICTGTSILRALFPAAQEPLPRHCRHDIRPFGLPKVSILDLSNAASLPYVASNIPVRGILSRAEVITR